jgi:catalase
LKTDQGIKNFSREQAADMAKEDPDFAIRDLFNAIEEKDYPSWTM